MKEPTRREYMVSGTGWLCIREVDIKHKCGPYEPVFELSTKQLREWKEVIGVLDQRRNKRLGKKV